MRILSRETWGYAILLIVLFALATLAVWHTISFLEQHLQLAQFKIIALLLWTITLGFIMIAGAFGLWAIEFSGEAESRRRIGLLVDTMDYISDGLVAVNRRGRITGSNPAAGAMTEASLNSKEYLGDVFPCLSTDDVELLVSSTGANELERIRESGEEQRTLRFRSQPTEGLMLILISDVTTMSAQRTRQRQIARLQLIGQLARGVAHDFNNILCGISGHAALLNRVPPDSPEMTLSIDAINKGAERGIALAGHLLELALPAASVHFSDILGNHVKAACDLLRGSLPPGWTISEEVSESLPPVALTGIQIEQVILNLGLLAADSELAPETLTVTAEPSSSKTHLLNVGGHFAAVLLISATRAPHDDAAADTIVREPPSDTGVIESVIRSLLEEAGGRLDCLTSTAGSPIYRAALPLGHVDVPGSTAADLAPELKAYVSQCTVLLAGQGKEFAPLQKTLADLGTKVSRVGDIMSALVGIEESPELDAMILEESLLGQEANGLLKAILKLHPNAGILVLCNTPDAPPAPDLTGEVIFVAAQEKPERILSSMVEARTLAVRRKAVVSGV